MTKKSAKMKQNPAMCDEDEPMEIDEEEEAPPVKKGKKKVKPRQAIRRFGFGKYDGS